MGRPGIIRRYMGALGWLGALLVWLPLPVWGEVALATKPLTIPAPQTPNVVLTVEGSFFMHFGIPPFVAYKHGEMFENATRYDYSSHYNPIYYNPAIKYLVPSGYSTSFDKAWRDGYDAGSGRVNLGTKYEPTFIYDPVRKMDLFVGQHPTIDAGPGKAFYCSFSRSTLCKAPAYYYKFNSSCNPVEDREREACYSLVWVNATSGPGGTDERQNFANWYSFYRTRYLATITALHLVMPKLEGKIRLAWQDTTVNSGNFCPDLSGTNCRDRTGSSYDNGLKPFVGDHRDRFYQWLSRRVNWVTVTSMRAALKRAGEYLTDPQRYSDDPTTAVGPSNPARSCRDNVHIMISDGEVHDDAPVTLEGFDGGDVDSVDIPASASFPLAYSPRAPFMDYPKASLPEKIECYYPWRAHGSCSTEDGFNYKSEGPEVENAGTLADIAFYYWLRDLVPGLENNVLPFMPDKTGTAESQKWNPRNNPANWQHLVNYAVVTGMSYVLGEDWSGDTYSGPHVTGSKNWPLLYTIGVGHPSRVYDFWHAALNSRGQFFGVDEVDRLIQALETIAQRLEERQAAAASIAANSTKLDTGSTVYQALYHTADWHGVLTATAIDPDDGSLGAVQWTASFPAPGARSLYTWNGSAGSPFTWDGLTSAQKTAMKATLSALFGSADDARAQSVLEYLRGDQSQEQTFDEHGNVLTGTYRKRSSLLGDIVNSDPAFVADQDFGHAVTPEGADTASKPYKNFVAANKDRVKMLYVGANDGMLHGFIAGAGTGAEHACGGSGTEKLGQELFAYVPGAFVPEVTKLSHPAYVHRYYVDGSPHVGDAYLPELSAEKPWRTILLGTTGAGGRVIFALDVTNPCEFGPDKVLWERDGETSGPDWSDLGYTLAKPVIARLNNGKWAAVFGNGYNSGSGKAVLFIVDLQTGNLIRKFDLVGPNNGLAAPSLYDADGNGTTDYIYAGDMQGHMWKFDLTATGESAADAWSVAYGGAPLFTARNASNEVQPITAAPELGTPPAGVGGVMVYFGTGRFFADDDQTDKTVQSLYGILDNGTRITGTDRSMLKAQQILTEGVSASGRAVRTVSTNAVSYASQRGWYLDLLPPAGTPRGERVVSTPRRQFQRVFYTTMIPSDDPCRFGGVSWVMELQPDNGGMTEVSIFDLPGLATPIAGLMTTVGIVKSFDFLYKGGKGVMVDLGSTGLTESTPITPPVLATGRVSWREIID